MAFTFKVSPFAMLKPENVKAPVEEFAVLVEIKYPFLYRKTLALFAEVPLTLVLAVEMDVVESVGVDVEPLVP